MLKPIIAEALESNKYIQELELENLSKELDFEITGLAQSLVENDIPNIKLKEQFSLWFTASFPQQEWNESKFTDTVIQIKTKLKKIENL